MKNFVVTKKQLETLTNKVKSKVNEDHKSGSYMAKQQLFTIATLAYAMWEKMEDGEQLEDWMESKIAQSEQSITSVVKSFMYDDVTDPDIDGTREIDMGDIVIGQ